MDTPGKAKKNPPPTPEIAPEDAAAKLAQMAEDHRWDVVNRMLNNGTDPNGVDELGHTALLYATKFGRLSVMKKLLQHGADPNKSSGITRQTPLHWAVNFSTAGTVEALLAAGALPSLRNTAGETPLMLAKQLGSDTVARMLVQATEAFQKGVSISKPPQLDLNTKETPSEETPLESQAETKGAEGPPMPPRPPSGGLFLTEDRYEDNQGTVDIECGYR